jgi:predicted ATPase
MAKLESIKLSGYKSIASQNAPQTLNFGNSTIIIGANGSGKSNLVSFLQMLNMMTTGALQEFVGKRGSANSLLHYGSKRTARISGELVFADKQGKDVYKFSLAHASGDKLIFTEETIVWEKNGATKPYEIQLGAGHSESQLPAKQNSRNGLDAKTAKVIYKILRSCQVFQFHDTSPNSYIRNKVYVDNNKFLFSDAGNLAAYLYVLKSKTEYEKYYNRILKRIRSVIPQFGDFELEPSEINSNYISLNWKEKNEHQYLFGPHQLSDGSLRFIALAALLLQPPEKLPSVIVIDEPELGLHPSAIGVLASMVKDASRRCQVILATQSPGLFDEFDTDDIIVSERIESENRTTFKTLDSEKLADWLKNYSVSELWEKNVLGGQP